MAHAVNTAAYQRFCPGEETIKISDAICRGRRRSHFPNCHGCQFNDDEQGSATIAADAEKPDTTSQIESLFHAHEVSGTVPVPLSGEVAWRIGHAAAQYLRAKLRGCDRADPNARSIIVGRDLRAHSSELQHSLIEGIRAAGLDVLDIGAVDTPQVYFAVDRTGACGGIQTTAGHRSSDYNGFIICGAQAVPVTAETGLASIRDLAARVPKHRTGTTSRLSERDFSQPYADFVRGFLHGEGELCRRLKVVVDAADGMAARWVPIIFGEIRKLRILLMNDRPASGIVHEPDPLQLKNTRDLRKRVKQSKADLGVGFSGDASQCVFVDDKGSIVRTDAAAALIARSFIERQPGAAILLDLRSSRAAAEDIERTGGRPLLGRAGHALMRRTMVERKAVFGADLAGHFYFRDNYCCESAMLAFAHLLEVLASTGRKLSELLGPLQGYRSSGELRFQCPDPDAAIQQIVQAHGDAEIDHLDGITVRYPDWWFNVRPSRSESLLRVTLEARTKRIVDERLAQLHPLLRGTP